MVYHISLGDCEKYRVFTSNTRFHVQLINQWCALSLHSFMLSLHLTRYIVNYTIWFEISQILLIIPQNFKNHKVLQIMCHKLNTNIQINGYKYWYLILFYYNTILQVMPWVYKNNNTLLNTFGNENNSMMLRFGIIQIIKILPKISPDQPNIVIVIAVLNKISLKHEHTLQIMP